MRGFLELMQGSINRRRPVALTPEPVHVVAARLGDRPETILATYAHLLQSSYERAAAGMAKLLTAAR